MAKLLAALQVYFRENVEYWVEHTEYKEAGPQLLLQALLHRNVNRADAWSGSSAWGTSGWTC